MEHIQQSYRGFALLVDLNWDRLFSMLTIGLALGVGAFLASVII